MAIHATSEEKNIILVSMENRQPLPRKLKYESPLLIAAKNDIMEMVKEILNRFPMAIHATSEEKKYNTGGSGEQTTSNISTIVQEQITGKFTDK